MQTDWFARPVLHVKDVETSLRFYVERLGFRCPWRYDEDGVGQVDRQGCALILADTWPEKIGKGLMFISLNSLDPFREDKTFVLYRTHSKQSYLRPILLLVPSSSRPASKLLRRLNLVTFSGAT